MNTKEAILADEPLEDPKDDRLGYAPFAKNLSDTLYKITTEDCLVFALYGPWGTGKTSCLNFILHYINERSENERPILVRFNPWWFSSREDLLKQFFKEFLVVLHKNKEFKQSLTLLAEFVETISKIPEPSGLFETAGKLSALLLRRAAKDKEACKLREEVKKSLRKQNKRILVVIDDMDRPESEEIGNIFRVIKAVADFPKTTYLLAFDKDIVVKALGSVQGISDENYGEDYLEKIVQVPFHLPVPDKATLRRLFFEQLDLILSDTPEELFDQTYWGNVYWDGIDHCLNTMRDIKRLINALRVSYPMVKGEVNPVDFIVIKRIEVFSSNIYQLIRSNPDMFTGYSDR